MRIVSWNVAGLRACLRKGFRESMATLGPDIVCLQEVKAYPNQVNLDMPGYVAVWNSAEKAGYSGTLLLTKQEPIQVLKGLGDDRFNAEGRVITAEYSEFFLVTCYTPNSQNELRRLDFRLDWEHELQAYLHRLDEWKPVIYCGDLNVSHQEIDLARPESNRGTPGFSDEERAELSRLLDSGFVDTFRALHPGLGGCYSYWSYFGNARTNNTGWRLDYFIVSERFMSCVIDSFICPEIMGSDHCPVVLDTSL